MGNNGRKSRIFAVMVLWLVILGSFAAWFEMDTQRQEQRLALNTAKAFFQQIVISRKWNARHGGVYVPVTADTQPNPYLPAHLRDLTADNGLKLTRINPADMTRQMSQMAAENSGGIHFHITSLTPSRPENKATDWEEKWLRSFAQGVKEQGDFFDDGHTSWFRYMAPLLAGPECLKCHPGNKNGDIRGGVSVSLPYPAHTHAHLVAVYGSVAVVGLLFIFFGGVLYERKQRLFDAVFNSPIPTCLTDNDYAILIANESYWNEFGVLPDSEKKIKCYDHRPGQACHTESCPIPQIMSGASKYVCELSKEKNGATQYFIVTAKPLLNAKGKVTGIVESFQEITKRKQLEKEREHLIAELQKSLEQVKLLSGFIPICASCKKIRDDQGFWSQVESYISKHSEAQFSHSICPDCCKKLYPEFCD